jgi:hypothetical protein
MVLRMSGVLGVWLPSSHEEEVGGGGGGASEQFSEILSFRDMVAYRLQKKMNCYFQHNENERRKRKGPSVVQYILFSEWLVSVDCDVHCT